MAEDEEKLIGKVIHYYDKIMVAVVMLEDALRVGEAVRIVSGDGKQEFTKVITSMQIEHQSVKEGKRGDEVAFKVDQPVKKNWKIYAAGQ